MLFTISGGRESFSQKDRFRIFFFRKYLFFLIFFFLFERKKRKREKGSYIIIIAHLCIFNFFLFLVASFFCFVFVFVCCLWSPKYFLVAHLCSLLLVCVPFIYIYLPPPTYPLCVLCFMFSFGRYCVLALLYDDLGSYIYIVYPSFFTLSFVFVGKSLINTMFLNVFFFFFFFVRTPYTPHIHIQHSNPCGGMLYIIIQNTRPKMCKYEYTLSVVMIIDQGTSMSSFIFLMILSLGNKVSRKSAD